MEKEEKEHDPEEAARAERERNKPLLSQCYNLFDFEAVARRVMKRTAWGYYSSAADDEIVGPPPPSYVNLATDKPQRHCGKTTVRSTGSGSGRRCSSMWKR